MEGSDSDGINYYSNIDSTFQSKLDKIWSDLLNHIMMHVVLYIHKARFEFQVSHEVFNLICTIMRMSCMACHVFFLFAIKHNEDGKSGDSEVTLVKNTNRFIKEWRLHCLVVFTIQVILIAQKLFWWLG